MAIHSPEGNQYSCALCDALSVPVILQFYSAIFFDNGCTIHQHFVVEFHNFLFILLHPLSRIMSRRTLYTPDLQDESLKDIM